MPRRDYVFPFDAWADSTVVDPTKFKRLAVAGAAKFDSANGGAFALVNPLVLGGAGFVAAAGSVLSGGVTTGKKSFDPTAGALVLGDSDYPTHASPAVRTCTFPIRDVLSRDEITIPSGHYDDALFPGWTIVALAGTSDLVIPLDSRRFPPGAVLAGVTLHFRVGVLPAATISTITLPKFNLVGRNITDTGDGLAVAYAPPWAASTLYKAGAIVNAIPARAGIAFQNRGSDGSSGAGSVPAGFATATVGTDVTGDGTVGAWHCIAATDAVTGTFYFVSGTYANTAAYYNGGAPQTIAYAPTWDNVVDTSNYQYYLRILDASNTFNTYHALTLFFSNVGDMRPGV